MPAIRALPRRLPVLLLAAAALLPRPGGAAQTGTADEADLHFQLGVQRYQTGDAKGALEHFLASNRLAPNVNVRFNIARAYELAKMYPQAWRYYEDVLAESTDPADRTEAAGALERVRRQVAIVEVRTEPPGAVVYVDREDLGSVGTTPRSVALPAGRYLILVAREGWEPARQGPVDAQVGKATTVSFELKRIVGRVKVEGAPGTEVKADGEPKAPLCVSPCEVELPPGPKTLRFSRPGHAEASRVVHVVARETAVVSVLLPPLVGSILVNPGETGALVEVDGRAAAFTPAVVRDVPVGTRRVRVSLRGFEPWEGEVRVEAGTQAEPPIELAPYAEVNAASRASESVEDAPASITILDRRELEAFAYPTIVEALRGVRGVATSFDGAYASVAIRGIGLPNDYGNRFLVLSDGLALNDSLIGSSFVGWDGRADLGDLERIEVVRGAGSVLYGTGALSGVVNLVAPPRDEPTGAEVSVGTYENSVAQARASATVNGGEKGGFRLDLAGARSSGRDLFLRVPDGDGAAVPTVAHEVDAFRAFHVVARAWRGPLSLQFFAERRTVPVRSGEWGTVIDAPGGYMEDGREAAELRFEPRLGEKLQLLARAFWDRSTFDGGYVYEGDESHGESFLGIRAGAEARLVWTPAGGWRLSAGAEGRLLPELTQQGWNYTPEGKREVPFYLEKRVQEQAGGAYAMLEGSPAPWLRFSAGGRVDASPRHDPQFSPRLALVLRPSARDNVKVLFGKAFRAPGAYELYYNDGSVSQVPSTYQGYRLLPETIWSGELEYSRKLGADWTALVGLHAAHARDFIETQEVEEGRIAYRNSSVPQLMAGGDLEVRREWRRGWMVSGNAGYLHAAYTRAPAGSSGSTRLQNTPQYFGSVRAVAPLPWGVSLASRLCLEAPRRIGLASDAQTGWAAVADLVLTGGVGGASGVRWSAGLYNLFNWQYDVPVTATFATPTVPQLGRSLLVRVTKGF